MNFGGMNLTSPINRIKAGAVALAVNVRAYLLGGFMLRNLLTDAILTAAGLITSLARLNDSTPAGPAAGYAIIIVGGTTLYCNSVSSIVASIATGLSGKPVSFIVFRPNTSVQPWMYIGDNSQAVVISTKFLIDGTNTTFDCFGLVKVRSDGLIYKTGIREPQTPPTVSTSGTTTSGTDALPATTIPWTNVGGANPSYNYGHTSGGDGTAPVIIATPAGAQTLQLTVTGTATVNGATHAPGDAGPATSSYPANFTGAGPTIVLGAFTDGSGNVLTGVSPVPLLANVGAAIVLQVPAGAVNFQIGIDSSANTFSANSGAFSVDWVLTTSAIATKVSTLGQVTAYVFGDSPHTGPVAVYIWKNPNDSGSGISRSIGTANITTSNNSWQFNSSPQNGTVPMLWDTLDSSGTVVGDIPLFDPALESEGYEDFNMCVVGTLFFPAAGTYALTFVNKDQIMVGIGGGATVPGGYVLGYSGQTETVVNALPLVYVSTPSGGGGAVTQTINVTVPGAGSYQVEIDYDYWYHSGRSLIMTCNGAVIPPLPSGVRTGVSYAAKYRSSATGAQSNPGPASTPQITPVLDNTISCEYSPDPQVDKVDFYRQDEGLANYTYVATGPNTNPPTRIVDSLSDLDAESNQTMNTDDFEPFPSIDLPASGTCDVSGGNITRLTGTPFNTRWLAGTVIEIGYPTQLAYTLYNRPTSGTQMFIPGVPDGTNLVWNIAEPILANQPLPYQMGPTDNINFAFGWGDPLRPGTLYWCKGSNLDSAPDTNQQDITDPGEALVGGDIVGGRGVIGSTKRWWIITANFFNAQATASGTSGSTWSLRLTSINRGCFMPYCVAVEGGGGFFFRVDDGIHYSASGASSQSITDENLYPLFTHEGTTPTAIVRNGKTIYPPDDSQPTKQKFKIINGYLYYDYYGTDNNPHTLVFDLAAKGWILDLYDVPVLCRATNEDVSIQGTLVGCSDGTVRQFLSSGSEVVTGTVLTPAMGCKGWGHCGQVVVEYSAVEAVTLTGIAADANNESYGPVSITLPATGGLPTKYFLRPSPNKWKWLWWQFSSTDQAMQVYVDGCVAYIKPWGSTGAYVPVQMFGGSGGEG